MASKVTHAPQEVIDELDSIDLYKISIKDLLNGIYGISFPPLTNVRKWLASDPSREEHEYHAQAIIAHVYGDERLQPERETRYYVEFIDTNDVSWEVRSSNTKNVGVFLKHENVFLPYEQSITHDLAVKAQALYGGEIKEVK